MSKRCNSSPTKDYIDWDSSPGTPAPYDPFLAGNQWGLWVYNSQSTWTLRDAAITVFFPTTLVTNVTLATESGNSGWSTPVAVTSDLSGMQAFRTEYSGGWTFNPDPNGAAAYPVAYTKANGRIHIRASGNFTNCGGNIPLVLRRCVTIDKPSLPSETICFDRSITL